MDAKEFRFQRHLKACEEQSKLVKRLTIAGILFAILLLVKVLVPFVETTEETGATAKEIETLKQEQVAAKALTESLDQLKHTLSNVQQTISAQPWMEEKEKLIQTLFKIRQRSSHGGSWPEYQEAADATIRTISAQVREKVIEPLEETLNRSAQPREAVPELSRKLNMLRAGMDEWEKGHLGKRWYETLFMKDRELRELTRSLQSRLDVVSTFILSEQSKLDTKRQKLAELATGLENNIQGKEATLEELEQELQKILPNWLQGALSIEQTIQLFPFILLGLLIYIVGTARSLGRHYGYVVESIGLTPPERSDPSNSSIWTLTYRGRLGTALTFSAYLLFTLAMWFFFEWGALLLDKWLTNTSYMAWIAAIGGIVSIRWIGRLLFVTAIIFIVFHIYFLQKYSLRRSGGNIQRGHAE